MKPDSSKKVRVRNKSKYNSVPRKQRKTGYRVANLTSIWDNFPNSVGGHVIKKRIQKTKKKGLKKDTLQEYINDKI